MFFRNKNKIKKRTIRNIDGKTVALAKKNRLKRDSGGIFGKILILFVLIIFVGVTLYLLFFSPFLLVSKVNIAGTEKLDPGLIKDVVDTTISGKYLNYIPANNIMLVNQGKLKKAIEDKFIRIESAEVKKVFPEALNISIIERKSMLILCSAGACFIIDNDGVPYASANFASNELQENELLVLNDDGNKEIKLTEPVLNPDYMQYLLDIKNKLKDDLNLDIDRNYHTPQLISGDIRVVTAEGWTIYFDSSLPIQKGIDTLKLVLNDKIDKDKRSNLEYIDLRTDNKVYYKFKNSEQPQQEGSSSDTEKDNKSEDDKKSKNT
ncbi:MAG: FtsQ-type POTRA domain-containing protein [Parcubacteria group bacterium]|jgi:cell division septal protein FtsQ